MILRKTWRRNLEDNPTTRTKQLRDDKIEGTLLQVHEPGVRELAAAGGAARVGGPRQLQDRRPAARVLGRRRRAHAEPPRALPPRAPTEGPRAQRTSSSPRKIKIGAYVNGFLTISAVKTTVFSG